MDNVYFMDIEEIVTKFLTIIESEEILEDFDCTDGGEPTLQKKLETAVIKLKEETIKVQRDYRQEKFLPGTLPSGLTFDFLQSSIDEAWSTTGKADVLRGDLIDFMPMLAWISCERNTKTDILQIVCFLQTCDCFLKQYSADDLPSHFDERKEKVKKATEKWKRSCTKTCCKKQKNCEISCRNDAVLVQLLKFCVTMLKELRTFPPNCP